MKLSKKLLIAPVVAIGFLGALGLASYFALSVQQRAADDFYNGVFTRYRSLAEIQGTIGTVHAGVYRLLNLSGAVGEAKLKLEAEAFRLRLTQARASLQQLADGAAGEQGALIKASTGKIDEYQKATNLAIELGAVDANTGTAAMQTADFVYEELNKNLTAMIDAEQKRAEEVFAVSAASYRTAWITMVALAVAAAVVSLLAALLQARGIVRRLRRAMDAAEGLARGDLTQRVEADAEDEVGQLLGALSNSIEQLARLVGAIRQITESVRVASGEIVRGSTDLSARTEGQASSLEESASSLEQLTSTVKQNEDSARQAGQLAGDATNVAAKGGLVVNQVVETMTGITESSKKISEITAVIDSIAFQTNLLALNAAVEAARAGEQGRGFAVVASEVRGLAQRSAAAAKEIKGLIDDSVGRVETGSRLVADAGNTMGDIVTAVKKVAEIVTAISGASREQSMGIDQVNKAMSQIDQVTQQNAALVEEATAAAQSLQDQAQSLVSAVVAFKLQENEATGQPAPEETTRVMASFASAAPDGHAAPAPRTGARAGRVVPRAAAARPKLRAIPGGSADADWKEF